MLLSLYVFVKKNDQKQRDRLDANVFHRIQEDKRTKKTKSRTMEV